jgi:hypothetical protein
MLLRAFLQENIPATARAGRPGSTRTLRLDGKQALKKGAVALQRDAEVFGRYIVAAIPLLLEFGTLLGKNFGEAFHGGGDQAVRLLYGAPGFIDESGLNPSPTGSQILQLVVGE